MNSEIDSIESLQGGKDSHQLVTQNMNSFGASLTEVDANYLQITSSKISFDAVAERTDPSINREFSQKCVLKNSDHSDFSETCETPPTLIGEKRAAPPSDQAYTAHKTKNIGHLGANKLSSRQEIDTKKRARRVFDAEPYPGSNDNANELSQKQSSATAPRLERSTSPPGNSRRILNRAESKERAEQYVYQTLLGANMALRAEVALFTAPHKVLYTRLPKISAPTVVYINNSNLLREGLDALSHCNVLGFSVKTKHVGRRRKPEVPALIQIAGISVREPRNVVASASENAGSKDARASAAKVVFVFDLLALLPELGSQLSEGLCGLLWSKSVVVVGVKIRKNMDALAQFHGEQMPCFASPMRGIVELGLVKDEIITSRLWALTARFVGVRLTRKEGAVDWKVRPLTAAQVVYAGNEARASLLVYLSAGIGAFEGEEEEFLVKQMGGKE